MKASRLLLGIGSPIVCDDGLGFRVVEEIKKMTPDQIAAAHKAGQFDELMRGA